MLYPRNKLEEKILKDPEIKRGLKYGEPRDGHPEGLVENHVNEIFEKIELHNYSPKIKDDLRLIGIIHDSFKFKVDWNKPMIGENNHGVIAKRFAEKHISDSVILDIIELHDAYYYMWRKFKNEGIFSGDEFDALVNRIGDGMDLYVKFMFIDGTTGNKDIEPRTWFYEKLLNSGHLEKSSKPAKK